MIPFHIESIYKSCNGEDEVKYTQLFEICTHNYSKYFFGKVRMMSSS